MGGCDVGMMEMMQIMMMKGLMNQGMMNKGMGKGCGKGPKPGCQWCEKGECWTHGGYGKAGGGGGGGRSGPYMGAVEHVEAASEMDVEAFLGEHTVEEKAAVRLRSLHPKSSSLSS